MRVLLAVHAFPPRSVAGVEVYTLRLARALRDLGHEVLVLSAVHDLDSAHGSLRRREESGVPVAEVASVHPDGTLEATYDDPLLARSAALVLEQFRPDCVHVQHLLNLSLGILEAARRRGAAVLLTLHDYWLSCPRDGLRMRADLALCSRMDHRTCARCLADSPYLVPPLQRGLAAAARRAGLGRGLHRLHDLAPRTVERTLRLLRRMRPIPQVDLATAMDRRAERLREALRAVSLFLAPTRFARERALEFGIDPGRVRVAALGAVAGPTKPRPPGPRRRFGFVGSLAPHKGVHVLLEAFAGLEGDVSLDLHGSPMTHPSYADSLRRASQRDPRVRWRGPFGEGEQQRVLAGLDLLVVPSLWWENSPLTVLEALAAGVAVVASATGGVPEILADREWGTLVPPGDVAALRDALCRASGGCELAAALPPLPIKTASEGASELAVLYETAARAAS